MVRGSLAPRDHKVLLALKVRGASQGLQEDLIMVLKARGAQLVVQVLKVKLVKLVSLA